MRISKLTPFLFGLVLAAAPLAGCDDGGSSTLPDAVTDNGIDDTGGDPGGDPGTDTPETPKAQVRFIHLSPDAPAVDIFAGGASLAGADDLSFPNGSGYLEVPAGSYDIAIVPAGGTLDQAVLTVPGLALEEGKAYTGVAYDRVASLKALALVDDLSTPMSGKLRVRAIHAAPDVGAVDIWNIPAEGDPAKIYDNVPFGAVGDYLELPAGAYTLGFDVNEDAVPDVVFETPALPEGLIINLFAVQDGEDALFLNAQLQDGTTARLDPKSEETPKAQVRFLHLSPDAPAVDIFAGDAVLAGADDLSFPNGSGYLEVPAGSYDIAIVPAGGTLDQAVLTVPGLALDEGKAYTGVAYDRLASLKATALVDDLSTPMSGKLRVRAIHMAPDVGAVDIWNIPAEGDPAKIYDNVPFGAVGDYLELPAGAYTLGFDVNEDAVPDVVFETPALTEGLIINLFAVQDGEDALFLNAQFQDGTTARIDPKSEETPKAQVRFIHLSPDAPSVDIFAGGAALDGADGLAFPNGSGYLEVPAGAYDIAIVPMGGTIGDAVLTVPGLALEGGKAYTGVAYDRLASLKATALVDDLSAPMTGKLRVRAIHMAPDVGAVDIWNIPAEGDPAKVYDNVPFGAVGDYLELPEGAYTLGFDVNEDAVPDVVFETPALSQGLIINLFAVQDGADALFLNAQFQDGTTARIDPKPAM